MTNPQRNFHMGDFPSHVYKLWTDLFAGVNGKQYVIFGVFCSEIMDRITLLIALAEIIMKTQIKALNSGLKTAR